VATRKVPIPDSHNLGDRTFVFLSRRAPSRADSLANAMAAGSCATLSSLIELTQRIFVKGTDELLGIVRAQNFGNGEEASYCIGTCG